MKTAYRFAALVLTLALILGVSNAGLVTAWAGNKEEVSSDEGTVVCVYKTKTNKKKTIKGTSIDGASQTSVDQMMRYFKKHGKYPSKTYKKKGAPTLRDFCEICYEEANAEGIRAEVLFAQICWETGYLKFDGDVKARQCNFGGMGATGNHRRGYTFKNVRKGIRAQVQHLKAYSNKKKLNKKCVDPRFKYVHRGSAKIVQWLGIQENPRRDGWAADRRYGYNVAKHINKLLKA